MLWRIEAVIGYGDHEEVADEHVDDSARVYAGSEEGWHTNQWEGCGEEADVPAEMKKKTKCSSIRSVAMSPPVSITHSPHKETEPLHCEPSHGYVGGSGDEEGGETHCLGDTVGCEEGDEGGELLRGEFFSSDVAEVQRVGFTPEFTHIYLFIGESYGEGCG